MKPAEYAALDAVNWSTLKVLRRSPLHYQHARANPRADADYLAMGRAVHTAVLEPDRFALDYAIWTGERRAGKAWEAFKEANAARTILTEREYGTCLAIRDAVRAHPRAAAYLERGQAERAIVWTDAATGLRCKARLDFISSSRPAVVDLKTARSVEPRRFGTASAQLLYHGQLAFYRAGWRAVTGADLDPVILAVESEAPHDVVVYRFEEETRDEGDALAAALLEQLAERRRSGDWPGIDRGEEQLLALPRWALPDDDGADDLGITFTTTEAP